jgi:hypothetical protein
MLLNFSKNYGTILIVFYTLTTTLGKTIIRISTELNKQTITYFTKYSLQYYLIKIDHYDERWRHAQLSLIFALHLDTSSFPTQLSYIMLWSSCRN